MFEKLGGTRVVDRIDNDVDYEDTAPDWIVKALEAMSKVAPAPAPEPHQPAPMPEAGSDKELIVFFGSQTGNAEELAEQIVEKANEEYGLEARVEDMQGYDFSSLKSARRVLIVCSTWGDGE